MKRDCFFADFIDGPCDFAPRMIPDPCHLINRQRIKHAGRGDEWDPRVIVPGCRRHHTIFDGRGGYMPKNDYPASVLAFAAEHGFVYTPRGWVEGA